jgi:hypothetical protein
VEAFLVLDFFGYSFFIKEESDKQSPLANAQKTHKTKKYGLVAVFCIIPI